MSSPLYDQQVEKTEEDQIEVERLKQEREIRKELIAETLVNSPRAMKLIAEAVAEVLVEEDILP